MNDIIRLLDGVSYRNLTKLCGEEGLKKSGKKSEVIKRLVENMEEETLRTYIMDFLGIGGKMTEHDYVPEHRKMAKEEIDVLKEKLGIKKWQLPKILDRDPIAMLLGAKPGDVLEIVRKSPTAGTSKYYRFVIRGN